MQKERANKRVAEKNLTRSLERKEEREREKKREEEMEKERERERERDLERARKDKMALFDGSSCMCCCALLCFGKAATGNCIFFTCVCVCVCEDEEEDFFLLGERT